MHVKLDICIGEEKQNVKQKQKVLEHVPYQLKELHTFLKASTLK
jgi:hypothetical protein